MNEALSCEATTAEPTAAVECRNFVFGSDCFVAHNVDFVIMFDVANSGEYLTDLSEAFASFIEEKPENFQTSELQILAYCREVEIIKQANYEHWSPEEMVGFVRAVPIHAVPGNT